MKRKKLKPGIFFLIFILGGMCISCEDEEKESELGKQAAIEFCDCYENNTLNNCLDKLKSKYYSSDYTSDHFISSFNSTSPCGVTLEKQYITSERTYRDIRIK